jgi:hypothetical protein
MPDSSTRPTNKKTTPASAACTHTSSPPGNVMSSKARDPCSHNAPTRTERLTKPQPAPVSNRTSPPLKSKPYEKTDRRSNRAMTQVAANTKNTYQENRNTSMPRGADSKEGLGAMRSSRGRVNKSDVTNMDKKAVPSIRCADRVSRGKPLDHNAPLRCLYR